MKRILTIAAAVSISLLSMAQTSDKNQLKVKKGWNFGPLPAVSYSTDQGFQYGALCDIFNYGDGEIFPNYYHKFNVEISTYTKGTSRFHLFYDSKYLIPGIRFTAAATYQPETMYQFYGFNGFNAPYVKEFDANRETGIAFYNMQQKTARLMANFQGNIGDDSNWAWAGGLTFWNYNIGNINSKDYDPSISLYNAYKAAGLIADDQAHGGAHLEAKAGMVYDSRDHEAAPNKGIWAEIYGVGSHGALTGNNYSYLKLVAHWRQYFTIVPNRLNFAYHLAYQSLVAGEAPWYTLADIPTLYLKKVWSEGLGGSSTIRGVMRNRILGNGYAWSNMELRLRLFDFDFINQHWYVATNPFFDMGVITKPYKLDEQKNTQILSSVPGLYQASDKLLHSSLGAGLKVVMNYNFIISVEAAKPLQKEDGNFGMSIGLNYIF